MPILQDLYLYPIKSCRGHAVSAWPLDDCGLQYDRRWMVVDAQGRFRTQRQLPRMTLIEPLLAATGLRVCAPGMPALEVPWARELVELRDVSVWRHTGPAEDEGDAAAAWFSAFLETPSRLVRFAPDAVRPVDRAYSSGGHVAFADGYPILLLSQASLDHLNGKLSEPVDGTRFRPNLVVSGCAPHAEDAWRRIRVGGVVLDLVKPCDRCSIPAVDPRTGERRKEPTRTLATYRVRDGKIYFGQNCVHRGSGTLRVGDPVEIL